MSLTNTIINIIQNNKMKKLLLTAFAALAIISCTKEVVVEVPVENPVNQQLQNQVSNLMSRNSSLETQLNELMNDYNDGIIAYEEAVVVIEYLDHLVEVSDSWNILNRALALRDLPLGHVVLNLEDKPVFYKTRWSPFTPEGTTQPTYALTTLGTTNILSEARFEIQITHEWISGETHAISLVYRDPNNEIYDHHLFKPEDYLSFIEMLGDILDKMDELAIKYLN